MRRRWIGAMLSALLLVWVSVLHAAFACSAGAHPPPPCHAGEEGGDQSPDAAPVCCQYPATLAASVDVSRSHAAVACSPCLLAPSPLNDLPALTTGSLHGFDPPLDRWPGPDPRSHLLQTLNL